MLFWLIPTGTQTRKEKELIGYDQDGNDGWCLTIDLSNRWLHPHLHMVIGDDPVANTDHKRCNKMKTKEGKLRIGLPSTGLFVP
ncbi:hypothetical protein HNR31_001871 [Anoxybacillus caldiproteolyticus]|uniref:Uncharacterized protein n=1 Tax=Thermaerobacillus caldiproteolyticus TaxID=247480 RepID=A0A7V9Z703_9BACL|nr:hypothetical protein [Anoxybacillus caldiproteolyticus]